MYMHTSQTLSNKMLGIENCTALHCTALPNNNEAGYLASPMTDLDIGSWPPARHGPLHCALQYMHCTKLTAHYLMVLQLTFDERQCRIIAIYGWLGALCQCKTY